MNLSDIFLACVSFCDVDASLFRSTFGVSSIRTREKLFGSLKADFLLRLPLPPAIENDHPSSQASSQANKIGVNYVNLLRIKAYIIGKFQMIGTWRKCYEPWNLFFITHDPGELGKIFVRASFNLANLMNICDKGRILNEYRCLQYPTLWVISCPYSLILD